MSKRISFHPGQGRPAPEDYSRIFPRSRFLCLYAPGTPVLGFRFLDSFPYYVQPTRSISRFIERHGSPSGDRSTLPFLLPRHNKVCSPLPEESSPALLL